MSHFSRNIRLLVFFVSWCTAGLIAAPVTNADIEKLLAANMGEDVILNVIAGGEAKFDTSADALIALKQKGASPAILSAITGRGTPERSAPMANLPREGAIRAAMAQATGLDDVTFVDGDKRTVMIHTSPDTRTNMGVLGFGRAAHYWVLRTPNAKLRTKNTKPLFLVPIFSGQQPEEQLDLTLWAVRSNGTREILTFSSNGLPFGSLGSSGFPKERILPIELVKAKDQPAGSNRYTLYEVRPKISLKPGEYALVIRQTIYDFGVDGP